MFRHAGSPQRSRSPIIITAPPSQDHIYSISTPLDQPPSPTSSIDAEYDFGEADDDAESGFSDTSDEEDDFDDDSNDRLSTRSQSPQPKRRKLGRLIIAEDNDDDEDMKIAAGADALLNLAGISTRVKTSRRASPTLKNNNNNNKSVLSKA